MNPRCCAMQLEILRFLLGDYSEQLAAFRYMLVQSVRDFNGQTVFPANPSALGGRAHLQAYTTQPPKHRIYAAGTLGKAPLTSTGGRGILVILASHACAGVYNLQFDIKAAKTSAAAALVVPDFVAEQPAVDIPEDQGKRAFCTAS